MPQVNEQEDALQALRRYRPRAYALMVKMAEKQLAKGHDYSGAGGAAESKSYENLKAAEDLGMPAWKGVMIRMSDKWARLRNFAKQQVFLVKDESFEDTNIDLANYCIFNIIMYSDYKASIEEPAKAAVSARIDEEVILRGRRGDG